MIFKEITLPKKTFASHIRERIIGHPPQQAPSQVPVAEHWAKLRYTTWLENHVRPTWPVGTLCTIAAMPKGDVIPVPLYRVIELQEVAWMAPISTHVNEPAALIVTSHMAPYLQVPYAPAALRKLTEKELELVRAFDRPAGEEGTPAANETYSG